MLCTTDQSCSWNYFYHIDHCLETTFHLVETKHYRQACKRERDARYMFVIGFHHFNGDSPSEEVDCANHPPLDCPVPTHSSVVVADVIPNPHPPNSALPTFVPCDDECCLGLCRSTLLVGLPRWSCSNSDGFEYGWAREWYWPWWDASPNCVTHDSTIGTQIPLTNW